MLQSHGLRLQALIVVLGTTATSALRRVATAAVPPGDYDLWSARRKHDWFMANLDVGRGGSAAPADWLSGPEYPKTCIDGEFLRPGGFKTRSDVVRPYEMRVFNIHGTGIAARVKAVWDPGVSSRYTGMFKQADFGFARWSFQMITFNMSARMAAAEAYRKGTYNPEPMPSPPPLEPNCAVLDCFKVRRLPVYNVKDIAEEDRPESQTFLAVKFFRGGVPSANLHLGGAGTTWDHVARQYTNLQIRNQADAPNSTRLGLFTSASMMGAQRGTRWPGFTGLHDMAMYDQDGKLEHDIMFPYQLLLQPTPEAKNVIPMNCQGGYERTIELAKGKLRPGMPIYNIMAKHSFESPLVQLGQLQLDSELMLSADADRQVFFYHARFERDLILRPDLAEGWGCKDYWTCPVCPVIPELCNPTDETLQAYDRYQRGEIPLHEAFPKARHRTDEPVRCRRDITPEELEHEKGELRRARHWLEQTKLYEVRMERHGAWSEEVAWPPWKETKRSAEGVCAAPPTSSLAVELSGDLRGGSSLREVGEHRVLQRGRRVQTEAGQAMRDDDPPLPVDPLSNFEHTRDWICQFKPNEWPTSPRPFPWTTRCHRTLVQQRLPSEPEYAIDNATCGHLPRCNKRDGTWYSETYPCICGASTCRTGQLCQEASSTCTSWGPYAK